MRTRAIIMLLAAIGLLVGALGAVSSGEAARMLVMSGMILVGLVMVPIGGYAAGYRDWPHLVFVAYFVAGAAGVLAAFAAGNRVATLPVAFLAMGTCAAVIYGSLRVRAAHY